MCSLLSLCFGKLRILCLLKVVDLLICLLVVNRFINVNVVCDLFELDLFIIFSVFLVCREKFKLLIVVMLLFGVLKVICKFFMFSSVLVCCCVSGIVVVLIMFMVVFFNDFLG